MSERVRLRLLVDENVPGSVVTFLTDRGHDVKLVRELFAAGTPDPVVEMAAARQGMILLTYRARRAGLHLRRDNSNPPERPHPVMRIVLQGEAARGRLLIEKWIEKVELACIASPVTRETNPPRVIEVRERGVSIR